MANKSKCTNEVVRTRSQTMAIAKSQRKDEAIDGTSTNKKNYLMNKKKQTKGTNSDDSFHSTSGDFEVEVEHEPQLSDENYSISNLWSAVKSLKEAVKFISSQYDDIMKSYSTVLADNRQLKTQNTKQSDEIVLLKQNLHRVVHTVNDNEQEKLKRNIVLHNLPNIEQRESKKTLVNIARKLEINMVENDIELVHRYPLKSNQKFDYVYKLKSQDVHSELLKKRKTRKLIQNNLDVIQSDSLRGDVNHNNTGAKVLIKEHITPFNYSLLQKTRSLHNFGYKYVWFKHGKIYARKTDDSNIIRISSIETVDEIILKNIAQNNTE